MRSSVHHNVEPAVMMYKQRLFVLVVAPWFLVAGERSASADPPKPRHPAVTVRANYPGANAATVLHRLLPESPRYALWLVGLTGSGKSFAARLFANFFGDFPFGAEGRSATWAATGNYLQRQGYFFRDALYLVDDYKPEVIQHYQVVRLIQNYTDGTGRGRLKSDATTNTSRSIRGMLVSTGEDVPQHTASGIARSIVVDVPQLGKVTERGSRCVAECRNYPGVTADFIRWFLAGGRREGYRRRFEELKKSFGSDVQGQQNDARVASNFALLAASFELMAEYLGDVWPDWKTEVEAYRKELVELRNAMLSDSKSQQASEIFLSTLSELIRYNAVQIKNYELSETESRPLIGKLIAPGTMAPADRIKSHGALLEIGTKRALEQVQESLQRQQRPPLGVSERTLLDQLAQGGHLLGADGRPLTTGEGVGLTKKVRLKGAEMRCFVIAVDKVLG